jgi:hypothetical protein
MKEDSIYRVLRSWDYLDGNKSSVVDKVDSLENVTLSTLPPTTNNFRVPTSDELLRHSPTLNQEYVCFIILDTSTDSADFQAPRGQFAQTLMSIQSSGFVIVPRVSTQGMDCEQADISSRQ